MAYKSVLLSSLATIRYEDTIDTLDDLDKSNLPVMIPQGAGLVEPLEKDPRPIIKQIFSRSKLYPYAGVPPEWVEDRYFQIYLLGLLLKCIHFYSCCGPDSAGSAVMMELKLGKEFWPNDGHYSKESLFIQYSSIIIPKGSPLKVSQNLLGYVFSF